MNTTNGPHELPHWRPDDPAVTYAPTGREKAAWILWAIVSVPVAWALRRGRACLTTPRPSWHTLAHVAFVVFCGVWAYRGLTQSWALTVGATRAEASTGVRGPMPAGTAGAERLRDLATAAHDSATATALAAKGERLPFAPGDVAPSVPGDDIEPSWLTDGLRQFWPLIVESAHVHGVDAHAWASLITRECPNGNPACQSYASARGLAQIMPGTARDIQTQTGYDCIDATGLATADPGENLKCGAWYFRRMLIANSAYWSADNEEPAILMAAIEYNDGRRTPYNAAVPAARARGDICAAMNPAADPAIYCRHVRERWRQSQAERGAVAMAGGTR